jgi:hypothetical protein
VSLIARGLEAAGIPSVLVSVMAPLSTLSRPPRQVIRRLNIGSTVGRPKDIEGQKETLRRMVTLLESAEVFGEIDPDLKQDS